MRLGSAGVRSLGCLHLAVLPFPARNLGLFARMPIMTGVYLEVGQWRVFACTRACSA